MYIPMYYLCQFFSLMNIQKQLNFKSNFIFLPSLRNQGQLPVASLTKLTRSCKGPSINDVGNCEGGGFKNWSKLPTDSTKKLPTWPGEWGVKNLEKLPTSFMDSP